MFKKALLTLSLAGLSTTALSQTKMSQLVEYVQKNYANKTQAHPILIVDKDDLNWRISIKDAFGKNKEKEKLRFKIIQDYVKEKTGIEIAYNEASNFDTYISYLKNSAVAVPFIDGYWGNKKYKICTVFHSDPNSNQRLESERLMGLTTPGVYEDVTYDHLTSKLEYNELKLFSLYHELGHCLDTKYLVEAQEQHDDSHGIHESESFAETVGLFLLAQEGYKDLAENRVKMRSIYSRKLGQFFVDNPQTGFGNPNAKYGGIIYYLAPVLKASQKLLEKNPELIEKASIQEVLGLSKKIVEEHALDHRSFNGIYIYFNQGLDAAIEMYEGYEQDYPEFFEGVLDRIIGYVQDTEQVIETSFDREATIIPYRNELMKLDLNNDFCTIYLNQDKDAFNQKLQSYRDDLEQEYGTAEEQRKRQHVLMDIHESLPKLCK